MTEKNQIYKCNVCGITAEILKGGTCNIICCGEAMKLMKENTVDAAKEKHIPVVTKTDKGINVKVGSISHPMEEKHYIEWIEVITEKESCRKYLKPGDAPEADFCVDSHNVTVRAYCNLHGLWKA